MKPAGALRFAYGSAPRPLCPPNQAVRQITSRLLQIKTQTVLPSAETAAMLFWALLASGQIVMRKVDGWQTLAEQPSMQAIDLAA